MILSGNRLPNELLIEQKLADRLASKTAMRQKTRPPGCFLLAGGPVAAIFPVMRILQLRLPKIGVIGQTVGDQRIRYTTLPQLGPDTQWSITALNALVDISFGISAIALQALPSQQVEHLADLIKIKTFASQLALQLLAGMLARGQQADRRLLDLRQLTQASTSAASASRSAGLGKTSARMRASISCAISGFSFRNRRTFSLPWPIRSPL